MDNGERIRGEEVEMRDAGREVASRALRPRAYCGCEQAAEARAYVRKSCWHLDTRFLSLFNLRCASPSLTLREVSRVVKYLTGGHLRVLPTGDPSKSFQLFKRAIPAGYLCVFVIRARFHWPINDFSVGCLFLSPNAAI